ncbi:MAG: DUF2892 domain-containing protein [Polyangiales bacterium]
MTHPLVVDRRPAGRGGGHDVFTCLSQVRRGGFTQRSGHAQGGFRVAQLRARDLVDVYLSGWSGLAANRSARAWLSTDMNKLLPPNEHLIERVLRVAIGLGLLSIVFMGPHSAWGWIGLVPLATGLIGSCPAYTLLGIGTRKAPPTSV